MLKKTFNLYDLIFLGVGSTLGVGIYILSGSVAKDVTGPAIIISFLFAAIISVFAGLCFAEFGACSPSSGSIYSYCYATMGEFIAFLMGWNLVTEFIIGTASVVKALSVYLDAFIDHTIEYHLRQIIEFDIPYLAEYFDALAFAICILIAVLLSYGLKESVVMNNVLTIFNVSLVVFFIVTGLSKVDLANWKLSPSSIPPNFGTGGFLPYGFLGVLRGTGICFYGFVGFDSIATTGGEVKNPEKTLPVAIIVSLGIIFLAYLGLSTVLTLLLPYYLQDDAAPLSFAFKAVGYDWAEWIVSVGSVFGLCASLFGAFFPVSRILYAMAQDGLVFRSFGKISKKHNTPVIGTLVSGVITGLTAALLDVNQLISLNSIGTLLSYSTISVCVIILRYSATTRESTKDEETMGLIAGENCPIVKDEMKTVKINRVVSVCLGIFTILSLLLALVLSSSIPFRIYIAIGIVCVMIFMLCVIKEQPMLADLKTMPFKMPWVPFLPALSLFLNLFLMVQFDFLTWMRFLFWIFVGFAMYFCYGIFNSTKRKFKNNV